MSDEQQGKRLERKFEQPPDAMSCYADLTQIVATTHEIIMQFYEAIPGAPGLSGEPQTMRNVLRATVTVNKDHAAKLAKNLLSAAGMSGG